MAAVALVATRTEPVSLERQRVGDIRPLLLRPSVAATVSKAHLPLLIDLYWLRVLLGMAEPETPERNLRISEYGEFLTDLDPRFFHAYYFISLATTYSLGGDRFLNGEPAQRLVRKGIAQFPNDYRLRMLLAFLLTYVERDPRAAVEQFMEIAKLPNAPPTAIAAATAMFVEEGKLDEAIAMVAEALDERGTSGVQVLIDRKKQLEIEKVLRDLDAALDRAERRTGRRPESLDALIGLGEWPAELREDPHGGTLDVVDGRGYSSWLVGRVGGIPKW